MQEIYALGGRLDLAVTLRDDLARGKSGRVFLDEFCTERSIDLVKIRHINDAEAVAKIREKHIDWLFIIGWSQIAGQEVLEAPTRGVLGIHPTLLPEGRGRAPIPWAIIKGLKETGVTLFRLDGGVDTGDIAAQLVLPIAPRETATSLYSRVQDAHRTLLRSVWDDLVADRISLSPQDETKATVWPGRKPEDGRITTDMTVEEADRLVRGTTRPYPGAFWEANGEHVRIWAGEPATDRETEASSLRIILADGVFAATEYERCVG
jgi:methionyl-tRNA formyltransferase